MARFAPYRQEDDYYVAVKNEEGNYYGVPFEWLLIQEGIQDNKAICYYPPSGHHKLAEKRAKPITEKDKAAKAKQWKTEAVEIIRYFKTYKELQFMLKEWSENEIRFKVRGNKQRVACNSQEDMADESSSDDPPTPPRTNSCAAKKRRYSLHDHDKRPVSATKSDATIGIDLEDAENIITEEDAENIITEVDTENVITEDILNSCNSSMNNVDLDKIENFFEQNLHETSNVSGSSNFYEKPSGHQNVATTHNEFLDLNEIIRKTVEDALSRHTKTILNGVYKKINELMMNQGATAQTRILSDEEIRSDLGIPALNLQELKDLEVRLQTDPTAKERLKNLIRPRTMSPNIGAYLKDALLNNISTVNVLGSEDVLMKNLRDKFKHLWEVIVHSYSENPVERIIVENKLCNFMTRINEKSDVNKQKKLKRKAEQADRNNII